ncbi:unnamed protein product [Vitrella brassicaformis CCMP3155]|uniref:Cleavage and polyadenylation specificity factor subunit 3 n=2 Tax=Vitrella brassicaformis TaxID=1169539 RepID=A0A0G4FPA8_VITBC|nr:unnamed protein product [Vitrella brassicaformis CCMP3155]|mmetsp:Transcript_43675/g.123728  ORF Transcript_43675/g.123728 Transcript_43675/m.123728 type:complete len:720 (+) Transcript_43675:136-2295(+)|eukprot:CEM16161.1 unnamed protein product [Vitrella brassicaformis CCMP3155]
MSKRHHYDFDDDILQVIPLGAGCEVGRSCIFLKFKGRTVLLDCGLHPAHTGISALPLFDNVDLSSVDLCLVTHFHVDHAGAVPYLLTQTSFNGRIYMTQPTKAICQLIWQDYSRVSRYAMSSGEGNRSGLFSEEDITAAMEQCYTMDFHQQMEHKGIRFTAFGAGHVLGACMFLVEIAGVRVLYTGDYSREEDRHMPRAELPPLHVNVLICESTYGIAIHEPRREREMRFLKAVHSIVRRGGKCLLPVFALGRAQELLLMLDEYWDANPDLKDQVQILYASPIVFKCMKVFETFINFCGEPVRQVADQGVNPFEFKYVKTIQRITEGYRDWVYQPGVPCVVMAAPGMLQSGLSRDLFEAWAPDKRNGVIMTGYSVKGTLGSQLKSEPVEIQSQDKSVQVSCSVEFISFSAHADFEQTREFVEQLKTPNVVLVHGEKDAMARLRNKLQELHPSLTVMTPDLVQKVDLEFPRDRQALVVGKLAQQLEDATAEPPSKRLQPMTNGQQPAPAAAAPSAHVEGVLVVDKKQEPLLVHPDELALYSDVKVSSLEEVLRVDFPLSGELLEGALRDLYEDIDVTVDKDVRELLVNGAVRARVDTAKKTLELRWKGSPLNDLVADSISFTALELIKKPTPHQALQWAERGGDDEGRIFDVVECYVRENYSDVEVDREARQIDMEAEGKVKVHIDFPNRKVECERAEVAVKVRQGLRRCEAAMIPISSA